MPAAAGPGLSRVGGGRFHAGIRGMETEGIPGAARAAVGKHTRYLISGKMHKKIPCKKLF